ncbi:MAG: DUF6722 family protein [Parabacteroides sp.]|nr:DUF6722 family protein [Parabacteroides sp.]
MGNFERNNSVRKEREERDFKVRDKLAGYFFDLSKLVLTAITVASISPIIKEGYDGAKWDIALVGLIVGIVIFLLGYIILKGK